MDVAGHAVNLPALIALGVVVGLVAGMFGVGGGFLLTPLLSAVLGVPVQIAVGTGLCQMVGTATVALLRHRKLGQGEERIGLLMVAGSLVGVTVGARAVVELAKLGDFAWGERRVAVVTVILYLAFMAFLLASGAVMWRRGEQSFEDLDYIRRGPFARVALPPLVDLPRIPMSGVSAPVVAYSGLGLGFLSGLLGVGGGVALIPLLIYGFGLPIRHAAGTGISVLLVTAATGTVAHALQGNVHLGLAMVLLVGASVSAQIGALATNRLPAGLLRRGFVWIIAVAIFVIVWDLVRRLT
jgi:uncharacterized protein